MDYCYDKSLGNITRMISKALGKRLEEKILQQNLNVSAEQWSVLSLLYQKEVLTQVQIGAFLSLDKVRVLRIVTRLEKQKLVLRQISKTDKRFNDVRLTKKGKEIYHTIVPLAMEVHDEALAGLSEKDTAYFIALLNRMKDNLQ